MGQEGRDGGSFVRHAQPVPGWPGTWQIPRPAAELTDALVHWAFVQHLPCALHLLAAQDIVVSTVDLDPAPTSLGSP